jgi:pre-mRNA-splicing factor RBM22/SLT11
LRVAICLINTTTHMAFRNQSHSRKGGHKESWESSNFPVVCETCLGDNPYVRMTKAEFDKECKVCARPFTVFRWRPGSKARFKKTEICQICAKLKNVCQTCLLDLEFGLPVQVRDSQMPETERIPLSDVNREYMADQAERQIAQGTLQYNKLTSQVSEQLKKLARSEPYYKRNEAHVCSFFLKGTCNRGANCPYKHEIPEDKGELAHQNLKDRYYGVNDPVAKKILGKVEQMPTLVPPADKEIKTLYIGNVNPLITESDLRDCFYAYGELMSIKMVPEKMCAFVTYTTREAAESAAEALFNKLVVKGVPLRISWGKPQVQTLSTAVPPPGLPPPPPDFISALMPPMGIAPPPGVAFGGSLAPPGIAPLVPAPTPSVAAYYPSMDPSRMGSRPDAYEVAAPIVLNPSDEGK